MLAALTASPARADLSDDQAKVLERAARLAMTTNKETRIHFYYKPGKRRSFNIKRVTVFQGGETFDVKKVERQDGVKFFPLDAFEAPLENGRVPQGWTYLAGNTSHYRKWKPDDQIWFLIQISPEGKATLNRVYKGGGWSRIGKVVANAAYEAIKEKYGEKVPLPNGPIFRSRLRQVVRDPAMQAEIADGEWKDIGDLILLAIAERYKSDQFQQLRQSRRPLPSARGRAPLGADLLKSLRARN